MKVDPKDGRCRTCGGRLDITDADDCSMTVSCLEPDCSDSYDVEPDAFGTGMTVYYFAILCERQEKDG